MRFHHRRSAKGVAAWATAFATAAFLVQLSAFGVASAAVADARNIDLAPNTATNAAGTTHTVTATVTDVADVGVVGVVVTFTETGPGRIDTADGDPVLAGVQVTTGAGGTAVITTSTIADEVGVEQITGTIDPAVTTCDLPGGNCTNTVTKTWQGVARFIDVSPDTATNASGTNHMVTGTVTDAKAAPVEGIVVTFTETGTGFFVANQDEDTVLAGVQVTTDATGVAQVFTTTIAGQVGDETITGTIDDATTDCEELATATAAAGICTEDVTKTWTVAPPVTTHARSISLRLRDALVARGRVTVSDGFTACADSVPVRIQKRVSGHWKTVKNTTTSSTGGYRTHLRNKHGRYRALAPKVTKGSDVCSKAVSPTRRH